MAYYASSHLKRSKQHNIATPTLDW